MNHQADEEDFLQSVSADIVVWAAESFVPWEIVSPPLGMDRLEEFNALIAPLRSMGALGTRHALHYAFGLHLNPELPDLNASTILNYMRAYFCLYDRIVGIEKIDLARRLTPYINHFEKDYLLKCLDSAYTPDVSALIDDYLAFNPTRNRSLDMLPLFAHIDEERVRAVVDDPRIKSRPTFHYRLPNCDIDNPEWDLSLSWSAWLEVEKLANSPDLGAICEEYAGELQRLTHPIESRWEKRIAELIAEASAKNGSGEGAVEHANGSKV